MGGRGRKHRRRFRPVSRDREQNGRKEPEGGISEAGKDNCFASGDREGKFKGIAAAGIIGGACMAVAAMFFSWAGEVKNSGVHDAGGDLFIYRVALESQRQTVSSDIPLVRSGKGTRSLTVAVRKEKRPLSDGGGSGAVKKDGLVSQFGITWTFDKKYPVGQFVNGDWWVVGPVVVVGIIPGPGHGRNGSMVNPQPGNDQAYDDRIDGFKSGLGVTFPFVLKPGESLVSTISSPEIDPPSYSENNPIWLRAAGVLTCLAQAPPADSFRPPYCGRDKPMYLKAALRKNLLPSLEPVGLRPSLAEIERKFERPWLDHKIGWSCRSMHPYENMVDYGGRISTDIGEGALMLLLDENIVGSKEKLLIRYVQLGIDLYGIASNGGSWPSDGGHASGRKFPILFAGLMLNEPRMLHSEPSVRFGEDDQTFYVTRDDLEIIHHDQSGNPRADQGYSPNMLGMPEWGIRHFAEPVKDDPSWSAGYRRNLTAGSWCGWILAARILKLKEVWNHDALFDYQDRYMETELVLGPLIDGRVYRGFSGFAEAFWDKYRKQF